MAVPNAPSSAATLTHAHHSGCLATGLLFLDPDFKSVLQDVC